MVDILLILAKEHCYSTTVYQQYLTGDSHFFFLLLLSGLRPLDLFWPHLQTTVFVLAGFVHYKSVNQFSSKLMFLKGVVAILLHKLQPGGPRFCVRVCSLRRVGFTCRSAYPSLCCRTQIFWLFCQGLSSLGGPVSGCAALLCQNIQPSTPCKGSVIHMTH